MSKGVNSKNSDKAPGFLKEVVGLATVLFSALAFLCLLTGDGLFYTLGSAVGNFLYGVFGAYAYFFVIYAALFGLTLVLDKWFFAKYNRLFFTVSGLIICIFVIIHLAASFRGGLILSDELYHAFNVAENGVSAGGAAASLIIFPVTSLVSKAGAYVFYVLLALFLAAFLFRDKISEFISGRDRIVKPKAPKREKKKPYPAAPERDVNNEVPDNGETAEPPVTNFFFNEKSGFAFRTKREMAEGRRQPLKPWGGRFEFKNIADVARREAYMASRANAEDRDNSNAFSPDRSAKVDVNRMNGSPVRMTGVSDTIEKQRSSSRYERDSVEKDVYTIPVEGRTADTRMRSDGYRDLNEDYKGAARIRGFDGSAETRSADMNGADRTGMGDLPYSDRYAADGRRLVSGDVPSDKNANYPEVGFDRGTVDRGSIDRGNIDRGGMDKEPMRGFERTPNVDYVERKTEISNIPTDRGERANDKAEEDLRNAYVPQSSFVKESNVKSALSESDVSAPSDGARAFSPDRSYREAPMPEARTAEEAPAGAYKPTQSAGFAGDGALNRTSSRIDDDVFDYDEDDDSSGYSFIPRMPVNYKYTPPKKNLLDDYTPNADALWAERERQDFCKKKIVSVFANHGIEVKVVNVISGSSVTRYDISVPEDISLKEINSLQSDLEFRLQATGAFRMYCIPGSELIGIEVASNARRTVGMLNVFKKPASDKIPFNEGIYFMLGEDVLGTPIYLDLMKMPHLLICGATGTGKSVCLNTLLISLMYNYSPADLRLVLVDPKRVEFKAFEHCPHLVFDEILGLDEDGKANKAAAVLDWAVQETERRYKFLAEKGYKNVIKYNKSIDPTVDSKIPYLIILIDEFADFIMSSPEFRKGIEVSIGRLAQKARAAGVSIILATQRPSVDVISGNIKTNIPSRICFKTATPTDSRVVIDDNSADKLLSKGDCLFKTTENSALTRAQGAFLSDEELDKVLNDIRKHNECYYDDAIVEKIKRRAAEAKQLAEEEELPDPKGGPGGGGGRISLNPEDADEVSKRALRLAIDRGSISTSTLRSFLRIGYNRANSIVIWMERMGYITKPLENQTRKTVFTREQYEKVYGDFLEDW